MIFMLERIKKTNDVKKLNLDEKNILAKEIRDLISNIDERDTKDKKQKLSKKEKLNMISRIEEEMKEAAKNLDFERAMELRDVLFEMKADL